MTRDRPSRAEIAAALRYYEHLRPDGEPPPEKKTAAGPGETAAARTSTTGEEAQHTTTARAQALERFTQAKAAFHAATQALLRGERFAAEQADDALRQLNEARDALQRPGEAQ